MNADPTDRDLAQGAAFDGDEAAFRQLYRRHTPRLFRFALGLTGGRVSDAEDVIQEMWLRALRGLDRFRWDAQLGTWLRSIALNVWRSSRRRKDSQWLELEEQMVEGQEPPPPDARVDLERALPLLPAGCRAVVLLHDSEGLTHAEIGEMLGISPGTSKSQLFKGRRRLRRLLSAGEDGGT